ncbi:cytochrome c oxidase assembly protein subunit 19 [Entomortierella parvispora]|uniref:Cytochrome c oxidase assembly protein COX19 n=1 Tax=Entomortierella parvispora TaxID=205924 RepID=A0A9P3HGN2_9FUNG|nr:cytochrome c oxidase assembly protein subunit 19 [Entomortierella parvispora]
MSFGRPPSFTTFSANPPDRGSFPLDHDGECSKFMKEYLACLKDNQNNNGKCRHLSKNYLNCRMENGLMGTDNFKNLGFHDEESKKQPSSASATSSSTPKTQSSEANPSAAAAAAAAATSQPPSTSTQALGKTA